MQSQRLESLSSMGRAGGVEALGRVLTQQPQWDFPREGSGLL